MCIQPAKIQKKIEKSKKRKKIWLIKKFFVSLQPEIDQWCNGNTADFGSVVLGSSPGWSTITVQQN